MKINASGSRSGGIIALRLPATDMVATPHCGARFLLVEKGFDEISATGGHRILSPRPFQVHGFKSPSFRIAEIRSTHKGHFGFLCRSGGIRTRGLLVPNQTRYQTALHLEAGADEGTRTPDLLITNRLLYQLSHIGTTSGRYYSRGFPVCPVPFFIFLFFPFRGPRPAGSCLRPPGLRSPPIRFRNNYFEQFLQILLTS